MKLQKLFLTNFIFICFCLCTHSQTSEIVKTIRKDFQQINTDTTLKKITLEDEEFVENVPDGGAELTGFFKREFLVKIYEWVGLSYGNRTREFYFKDGKLFFVFEKFESFIQIKDSLDHGNVKTTFEGRYYFNNGKLIAQKTTGKRTFEDDSVNIIKELQSEAANNFKLLTKKKRD